MTDIHIRVIPREKISRLARYELTDTDVSIGFYENDPWLTTRLASMHQDPQRFLSLADKTFVFLSLFSFLDFAILDDAIRVTIDFSLQDSKDIRYLQTVFLFLEIMDNYIYKYSIVYYNIF